MSKRLRSPLGIVIPAATVTTVALVAAGMLGVAAAEAPTTTTTTTAPSPTVSVQGVATEPIEQTASAAVATGVYRQGMSDALTDGQAKAQFLATKAGVTLGAVQSIVENGGYIGCTGDEVEYLGEQPDFGSPAEGVSPEITAPRATAETAPSLSKAGGRRTKRKNRSPVAKHASTGSCTLSTQVSLTYALG